MCWHLGTIDSKVSNLCVHLYYHPQSNVLLKPTVQAAFKNANLLDLQQPNSKGEKLRKDTLKSLSGVKNVETCPLHIAQLSFEVVSQYMDQQSRVMLHFYGGRFNLLPESFVKFPSMTLGNLITRWLIPDVEQSIPPLRVLKAVDVRGVMRGKK